MGLRAVSFWPCLWRCRQWGRGRQHEIVPHILGRIGFDPFKISEPIWRTKCLTKNVCPLNSISNPRNTRNSRCRWSNHIVHIRLWKHLRLSGHVIDRFRYFYFQRLSTSSIKLTLQMVRWIPQTKTLGMNPAGVASGGSLAPPWYAYQEQAAPALHHHQQQPQTGAQWAMTCRLSINLCQCDISCNTEN